MKISIVYVSQSGNTEKMAQVIEAGLLEADPTLEIHKMNLAREGQLDTAFLEDSRAVIFGTPTYVAGNCWQLKRFFDVDCLKLNLGGKLAGCFATAAMQWGGPDLAIQNTLVMALTKGMLAYSSGTGLGKPYIHLGPVALNGHLEEVEPLFHLYGKRFGDKCRELFG